MSSGPYIGQRVSQRTLNHAKSTVLEPNEELVCVIHGQIDHSKSGELLVTNRRVLFYFPTIFSGYQYFLFPYDQITDVNAISRFISDKLELAVGSKRILLDAVGKGDGRVAAQIILDMKDHVSRLKAQPSQVDVADQIERLGKLREKGLITEEDFVRKKDELLERL